MDSEFLALSVVFMILGVAGIVLFYGPMNSAGDSCYCLIPSPEPGAAQGTSSIFLALGIMFFPMGLMKGGLPTFGKPRAPTSPGLGSAAAPVVIVPAIVSSWGLVVIGSVLTGVGVDLILVPGFLLFKSLTIIGIGGALAALGVFAIYFGFRKPA